MYLRKITTKGRKYYQIVESYKANGISMKRVIKHLGPMEKLLSIDIQAINQKDVYLKDVSNVEFGASFILNKICNELKVEEHVNKFIKEQPELLKLGKVMKLASIHRCIRPKGYNDVSGWLGGSVLKQIEKVPPTNLIRQNFNTWLNNFDEKTVDEIQTSFSKSVIENFKPDLCRIIIDFTNVDTYQQIRLEQNQIAKRGKPKSNKKSVLQINYALVCSNDGIPLHHSIYDGNINDPAYFKIFSTKIMKKYRRFLKQKENLIFLFDNGMNSKEAILNINKDYKFVGALKVSECKDVSKDITKYKCVSKDKDVNEVRCYEFKVTKYGKKFRGIASYHEKTTNLIKRQYDDKIKKVKRELKVIKQKLNKKKWKEKKIVEERIGKLLRKYAVTTLFDVELSGKNSKLKFKRCCLDKEEFEKIKERWGISFLFTNLKRMPTNKIIDVYFREKNTIEDCNKMLKHVDFCRIGPVRTWIDEHTRAHFLRCTIGLTIGKILAKRANKKMKEKWTPVTIIDSLRKLNLVTATIMPFNKKDVALSNYNTQYKHLFDSLRLKESFNQIKNSLN